MYTLVGYCPIGRNIIMFCLNVPNAPGARNVVSFESSDRLNKMLHTSFSKTDEQMVMGRIRLPQLQYADDLRWGLLRLAGRDLVRVYRDGTNTDTRRYHSIRRGNPSFL